MVVLHLKPGEYLLVNHYESGSAKTPDIKQPPEEVPDDHQSDHYKGRRKKKMTVLT
jgi:hypothetical protein